MHVMSAYPWNKKEKRFGDYKQAHKLDKSDPRWLHEKEVCACVCLICMPCMHFLYVSEVAGRNRDWLTKRRRTANLIAVGIQRIHLPLQEYAHPPPAPTHTLATTDTGLLVQQVDKVKLVLCRYSLSLSLSRSLAQSLIHSLPPNLGYIKSSKALAPQSSALAYMCDRYIKSQLDGTSLVNAFKRAGLKNAFTCAEEATSGTHSQKHPLCAFLR